MNARGKQRQQVLRPGTPGKATAGEGRGPGRDTEGQSLSSGRAAPRGGRVPGLGAPPPGVSPPARARWGARGAAPAARPHCDVAGPRQRLRRPPGLLRPPLSPSVRPSFPPSFHAPVSPGPPRPLRGGEGPGQRRMSPCNFAPRRYPEGSQVPGPPLCLGSLLPRAARCRCRESLG